MLLLFLLPLLRLPILLRSLTRIVVVFPRPCQSYNLRAQVIPSELSGFRLVRISYQFTTKYEDFIVYLESMNVVNVLKLGYRYPVFYEPWYH